MTEGLLLGVAIRGCFEVGLLLGGSGELEKSRQWNGFTTIESSQRNGTGGAGRVETSRWKGVEHPEARGGWSKGGWLGSVAE